VARVVNLFHPQVSDKPLSAPGGQPGEDLLQLPDVAGDHGEQVVHLAGDVVRGDDLRQSPDLLLESSDRARVVPSERRCHVHVQGKPGSGRVEPSTDDADDAGLLQSADAMQCRRGGQTNKAGEFDVRSVRVRLKRGQQIDVNIIKVNGHLKIHYLARRPKWQIEPTRGSTIPL